MMTQLTDGDVPGVDELCVDFSRKREPLRECVRDSLEHYFKQLDGFLPGELYNMVLGEVEAPLLETVMRHTQGNQSRAAELLGLNRGTLRKKLKQYNLI